jgi:hypothetical protein
MSNCRLSIVGIAFEGEAPPRIVTQHSRLKPHRGEGSTIRPGGASLHLSANSAACLNIFTNISLVSFPVCVFWFDG